MHIPRLLTLSLLTSVCVAPVVAQSASGNVPGSFLPQPPGLLTQDAQANLRLDPTQQPVDIDIDRLYLSDARGDNVRGGERDGTIKAPRFRARVLAPAENDATCYAIRGYRVTRDDPESDATRPAGYSTCQPATRFQVKDADDRREITPR